MFSVIPSNNLSLLFSVLWQADIGAKTEDSTEDRRARAADERNPVRHPSHQDVYVGETVRRPRGKGQKVSIRRVTQNSQKCNGVNLIQSCANQTGPERW